jgi:hypothetical protein
VGRELTLELKDLSCNTVFEMKNKIEDFVCTWNIQTRPQCHETIEYSEANSQLRYLSLRRRELRIFSVCIYLSLRMFSKLWMFSASPFSNSDI